MVEPPTQPLVEPRWCSDGDFYGPVITHPEPYECVSDQREEHDAVVAALMAAHPQNC